MKKQDADKKASKGEKKLKKTSQSSKERIEKARKQEEFWIPAAIIAAIVVVMAVLIYVSLKTGDRQEEAYNMEICTMQLKKRIAPVFAAYHKENRSYPDSIDALKSFVREDEKAGEADKDKESLSIWKSFHCPADKSKQDYSYVYEKPKDGAPPDFVVLKCRVHQEKVKVRLDELQKMEAQ